MSLNSEFGMVSTMTYYTRWRHSRKNKQTNNTSPYHELNCECLSTQRSSTLFHFHEIRYHHHRRCARRMAKFMLHDPIHIHLGFLHFWRLIEEHEDSERDETVERETDPPMNAQWFTPKVFTHSDWLFVGRMELKMDSKYECDDTHTQYPSWAVQSGWTNSAHARKKTFKRNIFQSNHALTLTWPLDEKAERKCQIRLKC